jgi:hypothetical protein
MRQTILGLLIVIPGAIGALVFGWFALQDYAILRVFYHTFEQVAQHSPSVTALLFAEAIQHLYRINVFANGVWTLLSAIYAVSGIHGLCLLSPKPSAG